MQAEPQAMQPGVITPEENRARSSNGHATVVLSPSLQAEGRAYEIKFVVEASRVASIVEWAELRLMLDPVASKSSADGYLINTVYLDTPNFCTFRLEPYFRNRKFRLRRYDDEPIIWMEQKRKSNMRVRKQRVSVEDSQVAKLVAGPEDNTWEGEWFRQQVHSRQLRPACCVSYRRLAFVGSSRTGPLRLTIDRQLRAVRAEDWNFTKSSEGEVCLLPEHQILELKFRDVLPPIFRSLIEEFRLIPASYSKYRNGVAAVVPQLKTSGDPFELKTI